MISTKYYYMNTNINDIYPTLWDGYILYQNKDNNPINIIDIDNILIDEFDINFYINIDTLCNKIYLSVDRDEKFYITIFEKKIKKVIKKIDEILNIYTISGEFSANEIKHHGTQYEYKISRNLNNSIILKRFDSNLYESKRIHKDDDCEVNKLNIDNLKIN